MIRNALFAALFTYALAPPADALAQGSDERVVIAYVAPANPVHTPLYDALKQHQVLERVRQVLLPIRWPRTLRLELKGCDEANAWYSDAVVTVCYEFLEDAWRAANSPKRPAAITMKDAFIGPLVDVFLHESAHAIFELLKIPLFGREEDAADQLAAFYMLHFPPELKRGVILGAAYTYASQLKIRGPRDLYRRRLEVARHVTLSDEHGTAAQRLYNLLCIAYGSDTTLFAEIVDRGFLPKERAELCEHEFAQVDHAYRTLIAPHVDK